MLSRYGLFCVMLLLSTSSLAVAVQFEEGEWHTEVRVEFNGAIFPVPFTTKKCLTTDDPVPNSIANNANCSISDISDTDTELAWTLHCDDAKGSLHGVASIVFVEKGFSGTMEMDIRDDEGELTNRHRYHMSGIRQGPCKE